MYSECGRIRSMIMLSKREAGKRNGGEDGKLLLEIEAISRALYLDKTLPKKSLTTTTSSVNKRSKSTGKTHLKEPTINQRDWIEDHDDDSSSLPKNKKSIWSWKTLIALTHIRNHVFDCCFTLQVHSILGLPPNFDNISLCVHWRRRDGGLVTRPARVFRGIAEFEEQLTHKCSVYATNSGPNRPAKYEAKHFLLYAEVFGAPELELGRHRFDLTRFLPLTLEELDAEKSSGKWTTSFKLSGKAKGATVNVSFGYLVVKNGSNQQAAIRDSAEKNRLSFVKSKSKFDRNDSSRNGIKDLHEVLPTSKSELSNSVNMLYRKFDEEKADKPNKDYVVNEFDDGEFFVTDCGIELCTKETLKSEDGILTPASINEFDSQGDERAREKLNCKQRSRRKSLSLDAFAESVACDFLDMLDREFEKDTLAADYSTFNFDQETQTSRSNTFPEDFSFPPVVRAAEEKSTAGTNNVMRRKSRASELEDLETEDLMHKYGLNERVFQSSSCSSSGAFGSPIDLGPQDPFKLHPLGKGLGPFLRTKNGGYLRTMSPSLFGKNSRNGGNLIMQVSNPIVVPAEMGSGLMEILQSLASVGIERLSMQANKMMPLEDITGKTMQQIAREATPISYLEASESGSRVKGKSFGRGLDNEYVVLEDLVPLAMEKIEVLSIEGLRIQSGMAEEDVSSNISPHLIGLEGAGGLQLMDAKEIGDDDIDGLMGLSLSLDEWMRLDSGEFNDEEQISERTIKILAAHHASSVELVHEKLKGEKKKKKKCAYGLNKKCGLFGNNFTVALMVQLRDPLRNYEPVGLPLLGLVQVERVFVPPKEISLSQVRSNIKEDEESKDIAMFKIDEVNVAGVRTEPGKKNKLWGCSAQQQSGSRWLVANGMGKSSSNKHPFLKSKAAAKSSSAPEATMADTLWSISARLLGSGDKWKESVGRNPNVVFPNETIISL